MLNAEQAVKKVVIDTLIFGSIILLPLCIFCFFNLYNIPLGFVLGVGISLINYAILNTQAKIMLNQNQTLGSTGLVLTCYFSRFLLYAAGLVLAFYLDYIEIKLFAWYSVFIGYMLIKAIIFFKYGSLAKTKPEQFKEDK